MELLGDAVVQGIAPAVVVAIYLIVVKLIDSKKEKYNAKLNAELVKSITTISSFITNITKKTIEKDKDKCKIAIKDSVRHAEYKLVKFVVDTLLNNHIDINKETILLNIKNVVNAQYYNIYSTLNLYEINGRKVSEHLKEEWLGEIEESIVDSIYNDNLDVSDKIVSFSNKINFKFQSYITYIINNAVNG